MDSVKKLNSQKLKLKIGGNKPFDSDDIKPPATQSGMFIVDTNLAKAVFAIERAAEVIKQKNAR